MFSFVLGSCIAYLQPAGRAPFNANQNTLCFKLASYQKEVLWKQFVTFCSLLRFVADLRLSGAAFSLLYEPHN